MRALVVPDFVAVNVQLWVFLLRNFDTLTFTREELELAEPVLRVVP